MRPNKRIIIQKVRKILSCNGCYIYPVWNMACIFISKVD
jgi:hypothetical protein